MAPEDVPILLWWGETLRQLDRHHEMEGKILESSRAESRESRGPLQAWPPGRGPRERTTRRHLFSNKSSPTTALRFIGTPPVGEADRKLGQGGAGTGHSEAPRSGHGGHGRSPMQILHEIKIGSRTFLVTGARAMEKGRNAEAAVLFNKALEADPASDLARLNLGAAFAALGEHEKAGGAPQIRGRQWSDPGGAVKGLLQPGHPWAQDRRPETLAAGSKSHWAMTRATSGRVNTWRGAFTAKVRTRKPWPNSTSFSGPSPPTSRRIST